MDDKILLDKDTLKALVVDTRLNILKLLSDKQYTLSDIAEKLNFSNSTIKEHLDILCNSGLIKKEETDRKWKYYSLTLKGKRIVNPREVKVLFAFMVSLIAAIGVAIKFTRQFLSPQPIIAMEKASATLSRTADFTQMQQSIDNQMTLLIIMIVLFTLSAFLLGLYIKKPLMIISKEEKR